MQPEVSIVVPVYNADDGLVNCIESLLKQSFENIEIILIDDGSTDRSGEICDNYAKLDKRISVYHKLNGGVSSARNLGIDKSIGKYLMFCDSDDWIEYDCIEVLYAKITKVDADIIYSGIYREEYFNGKRVKDKISGLSRELCLNLNELENYLEYIINSMESPFLSPCAKLYRGSIIRENGLYFDKKMVCLEDFYFNIEFLQNSDRMYFAKDIKYHYIGIRGKGGIQKRNKNDLTYEVSNIYKELNKLLCNYEANKSLEEFFNYWFIEAYKLVFNKLVYEEKNISKKERNKILNNLYNNKEFCEFIEKNKKSVRLYNIIKILVNIKLYNTAYLIIKNRIG
ncbi:glycosyltransferase family 2 protein [Terrisporobacter glycolicus]|uniref:glycosyltransferase family 2 protein n=1 Tax=Terrisporobacter petrolearius TaxID=1460447 RepID=UPI0011DD2058